MNGWSYTTINDAYMEKLNEQEIDIDNLKKSISVLDHENESLNDMDSKIMKCITDLCERVTALRILVVCSMIFNFSVLLSFIILSLALGR